MKPIILDTTKPLADLVTDKTNGLGRLSECISCIVQEEINGAYTATIQSPVSGKHYDELHVNGLIKLKPNETGDLQIFRINKISKPFNGIVTIYLNHISYDLSKTSVSPFKTSNASSTIAAIKSNMTGGDAFSFSSTVTSQGDFENLVYTSAKSLLGGDSSSVLAVYGGEFEWDNLSVKLVPRRGQDRNISLRRGKNLTDLVQTEDISNYYTHLKAYVKDSDNNIVSSDLQTIVSGVAEEDRKILNVDLSSDFDISKETGLPSVSDVNAAAQKYIENNTYGDIQISLTVSFVPLWQTDEYERYAPFERISMGDKINVYYETLGVNADVRMVSYEYDVLNERYNSITLGTVTATLASTIAEIESGNKNDIAQTEDFLQQAINSAKNMLTGAYGGHIVPTFNANKQWNELFAIDTTDPNTATNGLRLNANGLGAFQNGIDGDYVVAITIDGQIVADRITTGTLRAIDIEGVNITGSNITGTNINGSVIKFGSSYPVTMTSNSDGDGVSISGTGEIEISSSNHLRIYNTYLSGKIANEILFDTLGTSIQQSQFEINNYSTRFTENGGAITNGNKASYTCGATNSGSRNIIENETATGSGVGKLLAQIYTDTTNYNGNASATVSLTAYDFQTYKYSVIELASIRSGGGSDGIRIISCDRILCTQYINGSPVNGSLVQGRDTHMYTLQWDGSHCWLWVDVTRVGQIV